LPERHVQNGAAGASFLLVGAGGLGGPLAYALAAAGARALAICDPDEVDLSNLQRQIQFTNADVGRPKAEAIADELARRGYPRERIRATSEAFAPERAAALAAGADILIDGSDDLNTKFAVSDAAVALGLPCVIAGVLRYTGQVLAVWPGESGYYRCLFEDPPEDDAPSCAEAGVLGAAVAVVAGAAARAALRLARGDRSGAGALEVYDDLRRAAPPRVVRYNRRPSCPACRRAPASVGREERL
jgi:molybdopterin-synthase adenylyltransferase